MAADEIARAMAMDAMNSGGGGGSPADTYTKSEIDTKLTDKADADAVTEMQSDIEANKATLTEMVNTGQKNLLDVSKITACKNHGVAITNNGDGSLTLSGNSDYANDFILYYNMNDGTTNTDKQISGHNLPYLGNYVISKDSDNDGFIIQVYSADEENDPPTRLSSNSGNIVHFTLDSNYKYIWFRLLIRNGADFGEGVTFRPMVCKKELYDIDPSFQLYAMSSAEMTHDIKANTSDIAADKAALADVVNAGQKNLLKLTLTSPIENEGITYQPNDDGTITISGSTSGNPSAIFISDSFEFNAGERYVLSGNVNHPDVQLSLEGGSVADDGTGAEISYSVNTSRRIRIRINANTNIEKNIVLKPMLCMKKLYDIDPSYKPYAMSNAELTQKINELIAIMSS